MKNISISSVFIAGAIMVFYTKLPCAASMDVHYLQQGEIHHVFSKSNSRASEFRIFCYSGRPKYLIHVWQSVVLQLDHPSDDYTEYEGGSPDAVQKEYLENRYSWSLNLISYKQKQIKLDPFNQSCIGIETKSDYKVSLTILRIDYWKVLRLVLGVVLFLLADKLSRNTLFYYLCGITLGICTSFLILIYFISKLFPKKPVMYGVAACGWTVGVYIFQLLWDNVRVILTTYREYLMYYILATGLISFIVCYRWGPVENERTRNLIRWSLQIAALVSIYYSSSFKEASMGQIVLLLLFYNLPTRWVAWFKKIWKNRFPPKVRPLTNDEYYEQGVRETRKALEELRKYCNSPDCKQWQLALKLKDVKRFASFIEGNSHLSDEELMEYETSIQTTDLTDDEEYTEEED